MRISKYTPTAGVGVDMHGKLPGYLPPTPPAPPAPLVSRSPWAVVIAAPWAAALTGKWSLMSVQTEGMGDILWGYDWGPGQVHIPIMPHYLTPSIPVLLLASTTKYFLPSFAIKERIDGGPLAGSGDAPVAVSTPAFCILTQQCWDNACALSFVVPSSISFQQVSTRWVGFCFGDVMAGILGMAGDALSAMILSKYGGKFIPGNWDDQILGGLASTFMGHGANLLNLLPGWTRWVNAGLVGGAGVLSFLTEAGMALESTPIFNAGMVLLAPLVGWGGGALGGAVGDAWGSEEGDWGYVGGEPAGAGGADAGPAPASGADAGPAPASGADAGPEPASGEDAGPAPVCSPDDGPAPDSAADAGAGPVCSPDEGPDAGTPPSDAGVDTQGDR